MYLARRLVAAPAKLAVQRATITTSAAASGRYTIVDPVDAEDAVAGGAALFDLREEKERWDMSVNNATPLPFSSIADELSKKSFGSLPRGKPVYLLCNFGTQSTNVATALAGKEGYEDIRVIDGGLQRWVTHGCHTNVAGALKDALAAAEKNVPELDRVED